MLSPRAHKLLADAAQLSRERIREDRDKVSLRLRPLLERIDEELLDPSKGAQDMIVACSRDRTITSEFKRELGTGPATYLRERRMETAARLLADTDLEVWQIGDLVFDDNIKAFSSRFKRWAGLSPTKYREASNSAIPSERTLEHDLRTFARVIGDGGDAGQLTAGQRRRLSKHLRSFDKPVTPLAADGLDYERGVALRFWEKLRVLPHDEQSAKVRLPYGLQTTALFDVLREKSREEGRKDRQEGVRIAELAIASLDGVEDFLTRDELANTRALGCAWLGNAYRLILDYTAAQNEFIKARTTVSVNPELVIRAQIFELESELYLFQSRFDEALELKNQAVGIFRSSGKGRLLAEALLSRAAAIGARKGFEAAIPDFIDATVAAESVEEPHLLACAYQGLVGAYALSGRTNEALVELPTAQAHCSKIDDYAVIYQLEWIEGVIAHQQGNSVHAEQHFLSARHGFVSFGETLFAATVDLDLAELYLEQDQNGKAVMQVLAAMPVFAHFGNHPEATAAVALLTKVATEQEVSLGLVETMRGHLAKIRHNATL